MAVSVWLVCMCVGVSLAEHLIDVDTILGRVRGSRGNVQGIMVDSFLGIPFAEPPIGQKRFRRPVPIRPWTGTKDALRKPASCFQVIDEGWEKFQGVDMWNPNTNMSEDCLYLNVWAPSDRKYGTDQAQRAVLVWVYGGGFYGGTSTLDLYDGRLLASMNDVVVVSMQYRVGSLGFLYLGTADAPGNMGLVDQHVALQWIFNNIAAFGGDKHRVTLFGESAGAVSVSMHLVSPLSRKLFQYAIMMSGSAHCRWAVESQHAATKRSLQLAKSMGCDIADAHNQIEDVISCLQTKDPLRMSNIMWSLQDDYNWVTPILITIDNYFLRQHPKHSIAAGDFKKTSILLGGNKNEGVYFLIYGIPQMFYWKLPNETISEKDYIDVVQLLSRSDKQIVTDTVNFEYGVPQKFGERERNREILDDMLGDADFVCPVVDFARDYRKHGNTVYQYQFVHRTSGNPWPQWMGVMHGYEIDHLFGMPYNTSFNYTEEEQLLSTKMMTYWANFAKTG